MLAMGSDEQDLMQYFKKVKIVGFHFVRIRPHDALKMPQLMAAANNEIYVKEKNEDFMTLLSGIMVRRNTSTSMSAMCSTKNSTPSAQNDNTNKQVQALAQS
jgi:hypothetical protein